MLSFASKNFNCPINSNFVLALLDTHLEKVSNIIKSELEDLENPRVGPETGLRDFFMFHCEQFEECIRGLSDATGKGFDTPVSLNHIVTQIDELGHRVYSLLTYGGPLSRSGSDIQKGDGNKFASMIINSLFLRLKRILCLCIRISHSRTRLWWIRIGLA